MPETPAVLTLRVLKAEQMGELLGDEVWDRAVFAAVKRETLEWVLRYLLYAADVNVQDLDVVVTKLNLPETERTFMTAAEQLIERGIQRGIQQGRSEGRSEGLLAGRLEAHRRSVLAVLESRFGEIPRAVYDRISDLSSEARLMEMLRAASRSNSLAEFSANCLE
jgi:hypothetical protein